MKDILAIIPIRAGSQRVKNKNIRPFADTNLLEIKLKTLLQIDRIDIVVNTDCPKAIEISSKYNIEIHKREEYYASSECTNSEFFKHIAENTSSNYKYLMYIPVTSPLIKIETINNVIDEFYKRNNDSVNTTTLIKHHLWLNNNPLNYDVSNSPNSQNLPNIHCINYGVNILSRDLMIERKNIIGYNPKFIVLDQYESMDIDTLFDFQISEFLYKLQNH
jgi:CMP-N-acetylneuraminic acid synthetase